MAGHKQQRPAGQAGLGESGLRAREHLGWEPRTPLSEGLARQWEWQKRLRETPP